MAYILKYRGGRRQDAVQILLSRYSVPSSIIPHTSTYQPILFCVKNLKCRTLFSLILILLVSLSSLSFAQQFVEKWTPASSLSGASTRFDLITNSRSERTKSYDKAGKLTSTTDNSMLGSKLIIRYSISEPLEFAAELHYLYSRKQKITNPDGSSYFKLNGSGFADISLYCLYQWLRSSEGQKLGIMTMAELKLPTGSAIGGVGTGSADYNARIIGSYSTGAGSLFCMLIYIVNGSHTVSGIETKHGNEIFTAAGINSASWYGFGIDLALFYRVKTTNPVVENNGKPAVLDKINYRGVKSSLHKHFSKYIETGIVSEFGYFSNHTMWSGTKIIYKKPELCSMIGLKFTFQW